MSLSASLPATIAAAVLDTALGRLALLFLSGAAGDLIAARHAACRMLAAYDVQTDEELRLAAEIISFGFHALESLGQASTPDMPLTKVLRLRSSAVSLSRESHKCQRELTRLQRLRQGGATAQATEARPGAAIPAPAAKPTDPQIDRAIGLIDTVRDAIESASKNGGLTWTQSYNQRQTAKRLAKKLLKKQASRRPPSGAPTMAEQVSRDPTMA